MKTVKAGTVPGMLNEYAVEQDATVEDVLELADIEVGNRTVMLDGATTGLDAIPRNGATITVTQKIKGNV